jgi:predicted DNA-binding transcriptional regulator AlpA
MDSDRPNGNGGQHQYLSIKEAAPMTGMGTRWLWDRIGKRGGPPFVKRGRRILFIKDEFLKWAEKRIIP